MVHFLSFGQTSGYIKANPFPVRQNSSCLEENPLRLLHVVCLCPSKYRLYRADEASEDRNSCPELPDTCPGYTVLRMRTVMATSRGWCNAVVTYLVCSSQLTAAHSLFSLPLSSLTLQNSGTNRDHLRLNQLSQMENTTSLLTLVVTTSCPWYMHRINRLHECFFSWMVCS